MKAYAIKDPKGEIIKTSVASSRRTCIQLYELNQSCNLWEQDYKKGYRCVPVLITEVKTDK